MQAVCEGEEFDFAEDSFNQRLNRLAARARPQVISPGKRLPFAMQNCSEADRPTMLDTLLITEVWLQ
jgi:hypothetical protein